MNLTGELRSRHFPSDKYPEHFGPFELHTMVPYRSREGTLEVTHYQIVIDHKAANASVVVGFDDFAPAWPVDRDEDLPPEAIARRTKYREMAQFRALVRIYKLKQLSAEGVERLRDAGADVSEEACRQGLWIAVYGKYHNFPEFHPGKNIKKLILNQVFHETSEERTERKLYIASMDPRTAVRSFLYFERIKLSRFMEEVSREDNGRTEIRDRSIEWFVQKMMDKFPFDDTSVPEKRDNYRGARRHTSEARHVFVCHAEWLLEQKSLYSGTDRCISKGVLEEWVSIVPRLREIAVDEGRVGWGVWDAVWDKTDFVEWHKKERNKYNYQLGQLRYEREESESTPSSSRSRRSGLRTTPLDKGKGRATTAEEEDRACSWIPDPTPSVEEDDAGVSFDEDEWVDRVKRPRINLGQEAGPSRKQWDRSSPSLGGGLDDRVSSSLSRDHYQPSSSLGIRTPSSAHHPRTSSRLPVSVRGSIARTPSSSGRNPSSTWRFTSQNEASTPPTSRRSLEAGYSEVPAQNITRARQESDVIIISSDDDAMPMLTADVARSSIAPKTEVIDITDSPSEDHDEPMRPASESDEVEDDPMEYHHDHEDPPDLRQRTSVPRETVIDETPPPGHRPRRLSNRPESPLMEEVSDSQDEFGSSDSESKYSQTVAKPPNPRMKKLRELNDKISAFAPRALATAYAPQTWRPWRCNYPKQSLPLDCDPKLARAIPCMFEIDLRHPSLDVQRLLNQSPDDAEFLKHLLTEPCIFKGPLDDLPVAIFDRIVKLHREEHFKGWGVKKVETTDKDGAYMGHFEYLDEDAYN